MMRWLNKRWFFYALAVLALSGIAIIGGWQLLPVFAMPTFVHGKTAVFKIQDNGGATRDISNVVDKVDFPQNVETADVTSFGSVSKSYIGGLRDSTISITGQFDATVNGYLVGILGFATARTFEIGPEGGTAGKTKFSGSCFLTKYTVNPPVGGKVSFSADFQVSGDVTLGTY